VLNVCGKEEVDREEDWTLEKLVRRVKEFARATTMEANGVNVFKILTFGLGMEQRNLTLDQSGTVRYFRKG